MTFEQRDVAGILSAAYAAVSQAQIPAELQPMALAKAVDLLASSSSQVSPPGGPPAALQVLPPGSDGSAPVLETIAKNLGLDVATVAEVFSFDDQDGLTIVLGPSKFKPSRAAGMAQLALLIAAARQAAGIEEWTPAAIVRDVAKDFNRFDQANFAKTLAGMDRVFMFKGTSAHDRRVRVNRAGKEEAATMIKGLVGGEAS
jgi:hypothetical protein